MCRRSIVKFISIKVNCHRFGVVATLQHAASQHTHKHNHIHMTHHTKLNQTTLETMNCFEFDINAEFVRVVFDIWVRHLAHNWCVCLYVYLFVCFDDASHMCYQYKMVFVSALNAYYTICIDENKPHSLAWIDCTNAISTGVKRQRKRASLTQCQSMRCQKCATKSIKDCEKLNMETGNLSC